MLDRLVALLPARVQPYAKAVVPAVATGVTVFAHWIITGDLNDAELKVAAEGAALSLIAFLLPNRED